MKLVEVNWLRFYAITSILLWHCIICPTSVWGILESSFYTQIVYLTGTFFIPEANMPLFVVLSGYLFSHLYNCKKSYSNFTNILHNKIHRLVIPYMILGSIATLCVPERHFFSGMFWGDGSSLWFCIMLFWCILLRSFLLFRNERWSKLFWVILSILVIAHYKTNYACPKFLLGIPVGFLCLSRSLYFYFYFVLGEKLP